MMNITLEELIEKVKNEKVRIMVDISPNDGGGIVQHLEIEPWEPFEMKCPYGK